MYSQKINFTILPILRIQYKMKNVGSKNEHSKTILSKLIQYILSIVLNINNVYIIQIV